MKSYAGFVEALKKPADAMLAEMSQQQMDLLHMAIGVSGESGELLDATKRWAIYQKPLDRENVIEELGDLEFYLEGARQSLGITREEVIAANIEKLSKRYSAKYSNEAAIARKDKQ